MRKQLTLFAGLVLACGVANAQDPAAALNNLLINVTSGLAGTHAADTGGLYSTDPGSGLIGTADLLGHLLTGVGSELTDDGAEGGGLLGNNLRAATRTLTIGLQDSAATLGPAVDQGGQALVALVQGDTGPGLVFLGGLGGATLPLTDGIINATSALAGVPAQNGSDPNSEGAGSGIIGSSDFLADALGNIGDGIGIETGGLLGNTGEAVTRILAIFVLNAGGSAAAPGSDAILNGGTQLNAAISQGGVLLGGGTQAVTVQLVAGIDAGGQALGDGIDSGGQAVASLVQSTVGAATLQGL